MAEEQYVYAVTRVHINEQGLLSKQDLEQLISAPTLAEAFRLLTDKGWGSADIAADDPDALVAYETARTWGLIEELVGDSTPFNVFRVANDYHNLKAAIKLAYSADDENETGRYFLGFGTVPVETIVKAADEHDFSALPEDMAKAGQEAYEALAHTGVGQACDMVIDRAALVAVDKAGKETKSELLRRYAELTVDSANIKTAVRCCRMGKNRDFIDRAIAPAGTLNTEKLAAAAAEGMDAIYEYLRTTAYAGAVDELEVSLANFERWCDNQLIEMIRPQRNNYFSLEPLAAYILGRENEIKMVRLILSAKMNDLPAEALRERLRETYV
ncbi:V-type ATPase subunit [Ruminococcaceae bacterium OttesenSCG-928-O06]|nr:V-type ATPase subunit [Ruminococcaceae bacterium OttesenSCG-928-O06]